MMKNRHDRPPSFFWQGVLIVLPALLLAAVGFFLLRQDRLLARHEAIEQGRVMAEEIVHGTLPNALQVELPPVDAAIALTGKSPSVAADLQQFEQQHRSASFLQCLVDAGGNLVYPPPLGLPSDPQPLVLEKLGNEQSEAWQSATRLFYRDQKWEEAASALETFLASNPPRRLAGIAQFHLAKALLRLGRSELAKRTLTEIITNYSGEITESGLSLEFVSRRERLRLAAEAAESETEMQRAMEELCAWAVLHPSALTGEILAEASMFQSLFFQRRDGDRTAQVPGLEKRAVADSTNIWTGMVESHDRIRRFYTDSLADSRRSEWAAGFPVDIDNTTWLAWTTGKTNGPRWLVARRFNDVREIVAAIPELKRIPKYFQVQVEMAGQRVIEVPSGMDFLGAATNTPGPGLPGITASVYLTDPGSFFARQRTRTIWFGSLIGFSCAAVVAGFVAAWRAFQRQQRLGEMKTNFVSSVSHELRAPIASVRLLAEELEEIGPHDRTRSKEYHKFIVQECRRLSALIENVFDFARIEQGRKQLEFDEADIAALIRETVALMQIGCAERGVVIRTLFDGEACEADIDGAAMQQVLVNLLDNAIKHSPDRAEIEVGLEEIAKSGSDKQARPAALVRFWIQDHGEGIPPEDHARIFERFYRRGSELRRETQGVGLGLAIVKFIVEAHGGTVRVQSEPGRGSRFTVEIPREQETEERA